ncbi:MAG TPA: helix-turn-helix domain-containing protein [Crenalkalicoccus sp.]|jgi:AcrR family transcriptional regulator|nr:helix-turn-helix domain-containing protein [Crenalkalicoccus sp.]
MPERILRTADELFYRDGIQAVGVDTIAAEAGISKRTLYNHFPSKDALIAAYLSRRLRPLPEARGAPAEEILGYFDALGRWFASPEFRGCPLLNAVSELGDRCHPAHAIARDGKERRRLWFRERLASLGVADPDGLALQLLLLVDGAIAQALVRRDVKAAAAARNAARVLIEAEAAGVAADNAKTSPTVRSGDTDG